MLTMQISYLYESKDSDIDIDVSITTLLKFTVNCEERYSKYRLQPPC